MIDMAESLEKMLGVLQEMGLGKTMVSIRVRRRSDLQLEGSRILLPNSFLEQAFLQLPVYKELPLGLTEAASQCLAGTAL